MKIAIHHTPNSFSERWIAWCKTHQQPYKLVDCYRSDILQQLDDCDALMWHWHHADEKAVRFARQLTYSVEATGKKVFPDSHTCWHFDDKVGQKYLLEAIDAPLVPSWVFYSRQEAMEWLQQTTFPKVFKLRGGAGSSNVKLARTKAAAEKLVDQAFGRGFAPRDPFYRFNEGLRKLKKDKNIAGLKATLRGLARVFIPTPFEKMQGREKGYAYFQEFIPANKFDTRMIVIGDRCFAIRRYNRENDFRASGSGLIGYAKELFDERCVRISFDIARRLQSQSLALDFIFDADNHPLIVEISYGFAIAVYDACEGYWDDRLVWHAGAFQPQHFMMEDMVSSGKPVHSKVQPV